MHGGGGGMHDDGVDEDVADEGGLQLNEAAVAVEAKGGGEVELEVEDGVLDELEGLDVAVRLGEGGDLFGEALGDVLPVGDVGDDALREGPSFVEGHGLRRQGEGSEEDLGPHFVLQRLQLVLGILAAPELLRQVAAVLHHPLAARFVPERRRAVGLGRHQDLHRLGPPLLEGLLPRLVGVQQIQTLTRHAEPQDIQNDPRRRHRLVRRQPRRRRKRRRRRRRRRRQHPPLGTSGDNTSAHPPQHDHGGFRESLAQTLASLSTPKLF
mmetsp:Transcript_3511/g.11518  ORF Transcript_3511/g.11518 Transcript_3511/m.11518 type:complete len:267 (-) Transcript_3511:638-1438(-)